MALHYSATLVLDLEVVWRKSSFIMVIDIKENQEEFAPGNFIWSRIVLNSDHLNWISVLTE